jgi:glycosyltransferase involved in cell wall biosynthesis
MEQKKILVYEPSREGHFPFYLELVIKGLRKANHEILVATDVDCPIPFPEGVRRISTTRGVDPCEESILLAVQHQVDHLFFPCLETFFWGRNPGNIRTLSRNVTLHGIWIGVSQIFNRSPFRFFNKKYQRTGRLIKGLEYLQSQHQLGHIFVINERIQENSDRLSFPTALLCDPWRPFIPQTKQNARTRLSLPQDRRIFLHIGTDERRKGLLDALKVMDGIDANPPLLVRAGKLKKHTSKHKALIDRLVASKKLLCLNEWIAEETFDLLMQAADYVLLPYRTFPDSSGILSRAIGHQVPVIASDYGLIGERVKKYGCGLVCPDRDMKALGRLLAECASHKAPPSFSFPVEEYTPESFVSGIAEKFLSAAVSQRSPL